MSKTNFISVVMPSLGGDICDTLDSINSNSILPGEIIVCLPNDTHSVKNASKYENLTVIYAEQYGQVYQRITGFKKAKGDYILQLDDDVLLDKQCLECLIGSIKKLPKKSTISPYIVDRDGYPLIKQIQMLLLSIYRKLTNKNKQKIEKVVKVDSQAGGCVLHRRKNLVLKDFYPYKGKAYFEDEIHSFLLKKSGISLFVDTRARCKTYRAPLPLKDVVRGFKIRLYFVKISGSGMTKVLFNYVIFIITSIRVAYIINFFKSK